MDTNTLLIIILVVLLLGGGGLFPSAIEGGEVLPDHVERLPRSSSDGYAGVLNRTSPLWSPLEVPHPP